jgi:hypothetical protein
VAIESPTNAPPTSPATLALAWLAVGLPLLWGVLQTIKKTLALFN